MAAASALPNRLASMALCGFLLAGCHDAAGDPDDKVVAVSHPRDLPQWLTVKDKIDPSVWLRSREKGREVWESDPEVDRLRRAMHQAEVRFFEDERMIANRTAQTADMMAEMQQPEPSVDVLTGMVDVADVSPRKQLYGEMCQHYLNIRKTGQDRSAALEQLKATVKSQDGLR